MARDYDQVIAEHYRSVAETCGTSGDATMADRIIRTQETTAIAKVVAAELRARGRSLRIVDVGCGNGYTLEQLAREHVEASFTGFEFSPDLRALAQSRFAGIPNVAVYPGDIRERGFTGGRQFDVLLCQRVLINLMSSDDQRLALGNLIENVSSGGVLVFIEAFAKPLAALNAARAEFDLAPIPPAHHNLYLDDDFFEHPLILPEQSEHTAPSNFLSTHYFVTRVLHPLLLADRPFQRNSHLVSFLSAALPPAVGDYGTLRFRTFRKVA
jgi:SAM-dependent methyltransferase